MRTNLNYWDCECEYDYIHLKESGNYCPSCDTHEKEQPDSIDLEVSYLYDPEKDGAEHVKPSNQDIDASALWSVG